MWTFDDQRILRQLADALPFGVCIVDRGRKVHYWNAGAELITGRIRQDVLGHSCTEDLFVHCTASGSTACSPECCPLTFGPCEGSPSGSRRFFLRHKQGHQIPVIVRLIPLRDEDGMIVARAEIFHEESATEDDSCWLEGPLSRLDPALGIPSAFATEEQLRSLLARPGAGLAVFLIETEHLHEHVRRCGVEMGRTAQRTLIHTLTRSLKSPSYLGCFAGDRLCVLVPDCSDETFNHVKAALAAVSSCVTTWWGDRIELAVKTRGTLVRDQAESLEMVIARLEANLNPADTSLGERA